MATNWARRALQGAVLVAVAASLPALSWAAGGGAGGGRVQIGSVAAGQATMTQQGSVTTIRTGTNRTIINFQRLGVGAGETLQFVQPGARSTVLGRIGGSEPTQIDGTLLSNGRLYLVNPAGIMFGQGAVINVSGLYASGGHISDADFLAGNNHFTDNTGSVTNYGSIQAGEVHLAGQSVANFGQIVAAPASGTGEAIVTLTAGKDVYIGETTSPTGETSVLVRVSAPAAGAAAQAGTGVTNAGTIDAGKGSLHLGAGDLYAAGIYNTGTLRGRAITLDSKKNTNISTGTIDAGSSRGQGGKIAMLGEKVGVFGGTVTASGKTGGGEVLIGGDAHGGGGLPVSGTAVVAQGAQVHADATATGDGGKVVVYSSGYTQVDGAISTVNGAGGHGGFVETSGAVLGVTSAPQIGLGGSWLLDPIDVTIAKNPAGGSTITGSAGGGTVTFDPTPSKTFVDSDAIATALQSGDVTITTGSSGSDAGSITWNSGADLTYNNNRTSTLTLDAAGDITLNAVIDNNGAGDHLNLVLSSSGGGIAVNDNINTNGGSFQSSGAAFALAAGKHINTGGGDLSLLQSGVITLNTDTTLNSGGGDITLRGSDAVLATGVNATTINAGTGTASFVADDPTSAINIGGAGGYNLTTDELATALKSSQNVVIGKAGEQTGDITWDAGAGYTYDVSSSGAARTAGLRLNTGGTITMAGALAPSSALVDSLNLTLAGGAVAVSGTLNVNQGAFFSAGSTFTATAAISSKTQINILQSGAVSLQAALDAGSTGTVRISGSTIDEAGAGSIVTSALAVRATDAVTLNGSNTLDTFGAVNSGAGKTIALTTATAFNLDTISAAASPTGLPAFAAVSGVQTANADVTLAAGGTLTISNGVAAGGGNVTLSTVLGSGGNIEGAGTTNAVSGANISLDADGGIGIGTAPVLATAGNLSLTTAGAGAAGNIAAGIFTAGAPGTLTTSQLATIATDGGTVQDVALGVQGSITINNALSVAGDHLALTATGQINGDGVAGHSITAPVVQLTAAGIGSVHAVDLEPGTSATLTTSGAGSAGNIFLTSNTALGAFTFDTDNGSAQDVTIEKTGAMLVGAGVGVESGDTLILHAGTSGTGNLSFTGTPTLRGDSIVLWAGIGDGTASTAAVDLSSKPTLTNAAGTGAPGALTIRQDASIADPAFTGSDVLGEALPALYTLRSDGGDITIATPATVAGTDLVLLASHAGSTIHIDGDLAGPFGLQSLSATASTIDLGGNVTTTGNQTWTGPVLLTRSATLTGANITLTGTLQSQSNQFFTADLNATGTTALLGNIGGAVGGGNELGALDATGAMRLGNGSAFSLVTHNGAGADGHVTLGGAVQIAGDLTVTATGPAAAVTFGSTLDSTAGGHFALTVNTAALTWFEGNVGTAGGGALGGIHTAGGGITQLGNGGSIALQTGSPMTFDDAVVLGADTSLTAPNPNGDVTFNSTVDSQAGGHWNLSINAANSISFKGDVGTATDGELGALTTTGGGTLFLGNGGSFSLITREASDSKPSATGIQSLGNPIVLMANTTLTARTTLSPAGLGSGQADVTLGAVSSQSGQGFGILVNTPGITWFQGGVSAAGAQQLGSIATDGQGGSFETTKMGASGGTVATTGLQNYGDTVVLTGDTTFSGTGLTYRRINGGGSNLTLVSDGIHFTGGADSVQGSGTLRIRPSLDTDAIVLGQGGAASNTLYLTRPDLLALTNGFAGIVIGSSTGSHAVTIASDSALEPVWFRDPVTIQSPTGSITVNSLLASLTPGLYGADNASLTLTAGSITLRSSLMTNGNNILLNGNVLLDGGAAGFVQLRSWGSDMISLLSPGAVAGNVTVAGTIDDVSPTLLQVLAASTGTAGNVDLQGAVGGSAPLAGLEVQAADLKLHANVSTSGAGNHITLTTSTLTLAGNANAALATSITLDTDASGGSADGGSFSATGTVNHQGGTGAVDLAVDTSAAGGRAGGQISFGGTIAGLRNLTLTAGTGDVVLGVATLTGPFFSSGRDFQGNGLISATGITLSHTGAVTLGDSIGTDGLSTAGNIDITGNLVSLSANASISGANVALTDTVGTTLAGQVTATGGFTSTGDAGFNLAGGSIGTSGADVSIDHAGGLVTLGGNINAGGGAIHIAGSGVTQSAGVLSGATLALEGTGTFDLGMANNIGTLAADVSGPLTFINAGSLVVGDAGSPAISGIATDGGALTLTVNSGTLTIDSAIDAGAGAITLAGPTITDASSGITGGEIAINAAGTATLGGQITGGGNVTITGAAISATGGITGATASLTSGGALTAGSITTTVGSILLSSPSPIDLSGTFLSAGGFNAGAVDLSGHTAITTAGLPGITLGAITGSSNLVLTSHGGGAIVVGAIGSSGAHMGDVTFNASTTVQLNGDIFAKNIAFMDDIDGGTRAVPSAATIFRDGSLTISADGTFTMEQNQKLSVHDSLLNIGDLSIITNGGDITLGDLAALGRILIDTGSVAGHIRVLARDSARVLLPSGSLTSEPDKGTDIVSSFGGNDPIHLRGTVEVVGGSKTRHVRFGAPLIDLNAVPGQLNYLPGSTKFIVPVNTPDGSVANEANFLFGTQVLDLVAKGTSGQPPSSLQGALIPREVQLITLERGTALTGALRDALRELGIYARDVRTDEILEYLIGRALYDDVPYKLDPSPTDNQVASNRLPYLPVLPTVDAYRELFFKPEVDDNGQPVMENGKPKLAPQDQVILTAFGQSWLAYKREKQDDATPTGFRGYLEAHEKDDPKFAAALDNLNQLRDLLVMIKRLGLTDTEFDVSQRVLLAKVRPANIREEDFLAVINGPTTRTGGAAALR
jgi:filamentous hemagglutinin family protein